MADRPGRRRSMVLAVLVVLGAAAAASAAALTWWSQAHVDSLSGSITTKASGAQADPLLIPVALLVLAGFGAALATSGLLRRLVGAVLMLGGGAAAVIAVIAFRSAPRSLLTDLTRPAESSAPADLHAGGPLLGTAAGLFVVAAGALLVGGRTTRRALGARYDAPIGRRSARSSAVTATPPAAGPSGDVEVAASWWKALDAGQDPTESDQMERGDAVVTDDAARSASADAAADDPSSLPSSPDPAAPTVPPRA